MPRRQKHLDTSRGKPAKRLIAAWRGGVISGPHWASPHHTPIWRQTLPARCTSPPNLRGRLVQVTTEREGGFITLCGPGLGRGGARALLFQAGELCFALGTGLWAEPGAVEQEGCSHSKSQAGNSRRQNFSVFQFSKIERIKQIRADVPTCNYQLISLDFFFFFKGNFKIAPRFHQLQPWRRAGWVGKE